MPAKLIVAGCAVLAASCALEGADTLETGNGALAVTTTFAPVADARVEETQPSTSYGSATELKSDGSPRMESALRFVVSGLTGSVTSAKLRLQVFNGTADGPALYAASGGWNESTVTWSTRPTSIGSAIGDLGNVTTGWVEIDVTSRVTADGTYDFLLRSTSSDGFGAYAREGATPPQLAVTTTSATSSDGGTASGDSGSSGGGTITIAPSADTRVEEATPTTSYGTAPDLKSDTSPNMQSYLRFDVTGVSGTVTSAKLRLDVSNATTDAPAIYLTSSSWSEATMTWSTRPAPAGSAIADLGNVPTGWIEYDVTRGVTGNGTFSFVLVPVSSDGFAAYSRETSTPPALVITTGGSSGGTDAGSGGTDAGSGSGGTDAGSSPPVTGTTYYVDDTGGNDANAGTSPSSAWRTLSKANSATLAPGDGLLFKRGGRWSGGLTISRSGDASRPITIGAYGSGELPTIGGTSASTCVRINGSYVVVRELHADDCTWAGFELAGSYSTLRDSLTTHNVAGVDVRSGATYNRVLSNRVIDNNKMSVLTVGGDDDSGAFGVALHGDHTEVAYNTISGCDAFSYDYGRDGGAVEIYGGQYNDIHHNVALESDAFTELGNSRSHDNTFAYNVFRSSLAGSIFLVTRGASSSFGPVVATRVYNNTVYLTGASSQGFVCHAGCSSSILTMRNNVIQAVLKVGYADAPFDEDYDLYYGGPRQFTVGSHSIVADPRFVSASAGDLHLQSSSPAIDRGVSVGYSADLDGVAVPQDGNGDGVAAPDLGAYELRP